MKRFVILTVKYLLSVLGAIRFNLWPIVSKLQTTVRLPVSRNRKFNFITYGEIANILYSRKHLWNFSKGFEHSTVEKFEKLIKNGDVVFDIGANIGMYSLLAADITGNQGKIYSFEPVSDTYNSLLRNIEINNYSNIYAFKIALSNKDGFTRMSVPEYSHKTKYRDAFYSMNADDLGTQGEKISMLQLDTFVKEEKIKKIDFIKVDIEGAELLFFKGASWALEHIKPKHIVFEAHDAMCSRFGNTVSDTIIFLHEKGYKLENYDYCQWLATKD